MIQYYVTPQKINNEEKIRVISNKLLNILNIELKKQFVSLNNLVIKINEIKKEINSFVVYYINEKELMSFMNKKNIKNIENILEETLKKNVTITLFTNKEEIMSPPHPTYPTQGKYIKVTIC